MLVSVLKNNQQEMALELINKYSVSVNKAFRNGLEEGRLTSEGLMFLLQHGVNLSEAFAPNYTKIVADRFEEEAAGRSTAGKKHPLEINSMLQVQAFEALQKNPKLPEELGLTPIEYAHKCYPTQTNFDPMETNVWYIDLMHKGVIEKINLPDSKVILK